MRAIGASTSLGLLGGGAAGTATAQSGFDEAAADRRIRETQTGPLTVEVVDANGDPVSGSAVDVEMTGHDFTFGTAIGADVLINRFSEGDPYREHLRELFNTAVLGNSHKWAFWEDDRQRADAAVDWLERNGLDVRGHTCVYGVEYAVPDDVMRAVRNDDGQTVRQRSMQHLRDIITYYGDRIQEWDVVNEAMHRGLLQSAVYPDRMNTDDFAGGEVQPWTSPLLADWYGEAESVIEENGLDVDVVTNDYNTLTWARDRYPEEIRYLDQQGIGVDAMGHQAHIGAVDHRGRPWTYATINQVFEQFADLPPTQRITEFDMYGDSWDGQQQRADVFRRFLKTAYGHPDVDEFMIWGMWDETHWKNEAPFFQADWSEKPTLDVWRNLVFDEWWTSESGTTGGDGTVTVDAFLGEHEISVDGSVVATASVTDPAGTTVRVAVAGGSTPGGEGPVVGDNANPAQDPDDDGLYEDVNGNGRVDYNDVIDYFNNMDDAAMTDHADAFDYNGNGRLDYDDLVDLFEQVH